MSAPRKCRVCGCSMLARTAPEQLLQFLGHDADLTDSWYAGDEASADSAARSRFNHLLGTVQAQAVGIALEVLGICTHSCASTLVGAVAAKLVLRPLEPAQLRAAAAIATYRQANPFDSEYVPPSQRATT